jgi:hypothetical protein
MMNIIKDYTDLPNSEKEINSYLDNFKITNKKGIIRLGTEEYHSEYNKQHIKPTNSLIREIESIIKKYLPDIYIKYEITRLNKVETNTNLNDDFHDDFGIGNLILLHYPKKNSYFVGGQFEWENKEIIEIKNGMNLILINNPRHRVLNVTEGERFSFAFFFNIIDRNKLM